MTQTVNGTRVFIAGSRRLSRLNHYVRRRLDTIVAKGFTVILGDANGVDKAVQQYLSSKSYRDVLVLYGQRMPQQRWRMANTSDHGCSPPAEGF